jgi:hypothetical protein
VTLVTLVVKGRKKAPNDLTLGAHHKFVLYHIMFFQPIVEFFVTFNSCAIIPYEFFSAIQTLIKVYLSIFVALFSVVYVSTFSHIVNLT